MNAAKVVRTALLKVTPTLFKHARITIQKGVVTLSFDDPCASVNDLDFIAFWVARFAHPVYYWLEVTPKGIRLHYSKKKPNVFGSEVGKKVVKDYTGTLFARLPGDWEVHGWRISVIASRQSTDYASVWRDACDFRVKLFELTEPNDYGLMETITRDCLERAVEEVVSREA